MDCVLEQTCEERIHLVAHSMGGLICRSLIQRVLKEEAAKKINRLFTYAMPHRVIHFLRGLGFLTGVRDLLGLNDSDTLCLDCPSPSAVKEHGTGGSGTSGPG